MIAAVAFFTSNWWRTAFLAALVALGVQTVRIDGLGPIRGLKGSLAASQRQVTAERSAHVQTITRYRIAQDLAQQEEAKRLARVQGEQERISDNVSQDYARELDALRARYARLRAQARTAGGAPSGVSVPAVPGSSGGTDAAAGSDRLLDVLLAADENTAKLIALQRWVAQQTGVVVN